MWPLIVGAGIAGLVGSPHCVGMCGGFAAACARPAGHAVAWHGGRLVTYGTLGALAGAFGEVLPLGGLAIDVLAIGLTTAFALSLGGWLPPITPRLPGLQRVASAALRRGGVLGAVGLGAATGLLPCGLVYSALAVPVAARDPLVGAAAMVAFGLGTVPALAAATHGLRELVARRPAARKVLALAVLCAGVWSVASRRALVPPPEPAEAAVTLPSAP